MEKRGFVVVVVVVREEVEDLTRLRRPRGRLRIIASEDESASSSIPPLGRSPTPMPRVAGLDVLGL